MQFIDQEFFFHWFFFIAEQNEEEKKMLKIPDAIHSDWESMGFFFLGWTYRLHIQLAKLLQILKCSWISNLLTTFCTILFFSVFVCVCFFLLRFEELFFVTLFLFRFVFFVRCLHTCLRWSTLFFFCFFYFRVFIFAQNWRHNKSIKGINLASISGEYVVVSYWIWTIYQSNLRFCYPLIHLRSGSYFSFCLTYVSLDTVFTNWYELHWHWFVIVFTKKKKYANQREQFISFLNFLSVSEQLIQNF